VWGREREEGWCGCKAKEKARGGLTREKREKNKKNPENPLPFHSTFSLLFLHIFHPTHIYLHREDTA
jgi:hypothetical protein